MSLRVQLYDAFSGINSGEKSALVKFLLCNSEETDASVIEEAIDHALKIKPSFGGFIFTTWEAGRLMAAVLVNKTGMSGFNPGCLLTYACVDKSHRQKTKILRDLIQRTIKNAKGDIGLHLKRDSPALPIFESLGFEEQYLELRFEQKRRAVSVG